MSIQVSQLSKSYGLQKAVDQISFDIPRGEIVGFLGPNGAGKSTTMKILTGYLPASSGSARVCGFDVSSQSLEVRRRIGYLSESNPLYPEMYVREFLSFMARIHRLGRCGASRIREVLEQTGLLPESKKKIGALSKGYRQRLGLAQAILHEPEVLILDEPTSGLDPNQLVEIRELIRAMGKNKTVILSTHILQEVQIMCSRVIIIHQGKLVADSSIEDLQREDPATQYLLVEWAGSLTENWALALKGVLAAEKLQGYRWRLRVDQPDAARKNLLQYALENNLNIISLQSESRSLEDLFRQLTHQDREENSEKERSRMPS